jgi:CxxC-x17-CxxC domain-containing protein
MGNFRSDNRDRGYGGSSGRSSSRGGFGGRSEGRGGFRDRDSGRFGRDERRPLEMHEVTCSKCGKQCEVPFKPTGDKPVFCSDCFRTEGGSRSNSRDGASGISSTQYAELNKKLDRILEVLKNVEFEAVVDEEGEEESEEDEFQEDDKEVEKKPKKKK